MAKQKYLVRQYFGDVLLKPTEADYVNCLGDPVAIIDVTSKHEFNAPPGTVIVTVHEGTKVTVEKPTGRLVSIILERYGD